MKPLAVVLMISLVALAAANANAVAVCFPHAEVLSLLPTTATFNGQPVTRSATTGRYATDAGLEFDHEAAQVLALLDAGSTACGAPASQLSLELVDPFSGERRILGLAATP